MMKISIYGAGHLAKSLIQGIEFANINHPISLYNRTAEKAVRLKGEFHRINIVENENDLILDNSFVFLIIPPTAILSLSSDFINKIRKTNSILISCANYITLDKLNRQYPDTKIIRTLPNILWQMGCGTTLYSLNDKIENNEKQLFEELLAKIGEIVAVKDENDFDRFGKITTCGPGIFSKLADLFLNELDIKNDKEKNLAINTFFSTLDYAIKNKNDFKKIIEQVANKGGLTECATMELDNQLIGKFREVFAAMDGKIIEKRQQIEKQ